MDRAVKTQKRMTMSFRFGQK